MDPDIKQNISSSSTWGRGLFMVLFGIIYSVAEIVLITVVFTQFCFVLITNEKNPRLLRFGHELSTFIYSVFLFLTFNSEEKPFPFAPWPTSEDLEETAEALPADSSDEQSPKSET